MPASLLTSSALPAEPALTLGTKGFAQDNSKIDQTFLAQIRTLMNEMYYGEHVSESHKAFKKLLETSPQRTAKAMQQILLDSKESNETRLRTFATFVEFKVPLLEESTKALFEDRSTTPSLRIKAAGFLTEHFKNPDARLYLVHQASTTKHGVEALQSLISLKDITLNPIFLRIAVNEKIAADVRAVALTGIHPPCLPSTFDSIASSIEEGKIFKPGIEALVRIDPMQGIQHLSKFVRDATNDLWRDVLISEAAHLHPKEALALLKSHAAQEMDLQALSLGIWFSGKIPKEELLKLEDNALSTVVAAVGTMQDKESKDFLSHVLQSGESGLAAEQTACMILLNQGDKTILPKLASTFIYQAARFSANYSKVQNTNEIISQFLRNDGYDAFIQATDEAIQKIKTDETDSMSKEYAVHGEYLKKILLDCKEQNFSTPFRFYPATLQSLLDENKTPSRNPEKLAVVILPASDWNGHYDQVPSISELTKKGYAVRVCVAGTDEEATQFIEKVAKDQRAPDVLVIGGHGSPDTLKFGFDDKDPSSLDLTDGDILNRINKSIHKDTLVVLNACSTARKETAQSRNLFEEVRQKLAILGKKKVFGATADSIGFVFSYDKNDKVTGVTFRFPSKTGKTAWE